MRIALTIAGSDSGGGAGIQGDLHTFAAHQVFGICAVTAVTAQNTLGVVRWEPVSTELVIAQMEAAAADLAPHATKTGMLGSAAIVEAVAAAIRALELPNLVVDPVMAATSGHRLLDEDAVSALVSELLPLAEVVTPNLAEAEALTGRSIGCRDDMRAAAAHIRTLGPRVVVVKGGHLATETDQSIDVVCTPASTFEIAGPRVDTPHLHGTGCAFSAAITAGLACGLPVNDAVRAARDYVQGAIVHAPGLGGGHGPLGHYWRVY